MKKVIAPLLCIPFLLLASCTDETEKTVTHSESKEFKPETVKIGKDSELNIVPLYAPYQNYLKASLKADTSEMDVKNYAKSRSWLHRVKSERKKTLIQLV